MTCSELIGMLMALGRWLQRLTMRVRKYHQKHNSMYGLVPAILMHCPLLAHLMLENIGPGSIAAVGDNCCIATVCFTFISRS